MCRIVTQLVRGATLLHTWGKGVRVNFAEEMGSDRKGPSLPAPLGFVCLAGSRSHTPGPHPSGPLSLGLSSK